MSPDLPHADDPRVLQALIALVTCGRVHVDDDALCAWLRAVSLIDEQGALDPRWTSFLPARNDKDLLRIALLRDPRYRLRFDHSLTRVLSRIAESRNWPRLESLLCGPLRPLSPRIAGLLMIDRLSTPVRIPEHDDKGWNQRLWGNSNNEDALAVIADIYPRFSSLPIGWSALFAEESDSPAIGVLLSANLAGEPLLGEDISETDMARLMSCGVPVVPTGLERHRATGWSLSIPVDSETEIPPAREQGRSWPFSIPTEIRAQGPSAVRPAHAANFMGEDVSLIATLGFDQRSGYWPDDPDQPDWSRLVHAGAWIPSRAELHSDALNPAAVRILANHPVYGLIIQTLIQDALDGAFDQDRVVLAPRLDHQVDRLEANTAVLYRPGGDAKEEQRMLELGLFDDVFDRLARHLGIQVIDRVFADQQRAWSAAFAMLRRFGWIDDNGRRWRLAERVFDRLHGAGLMAEVIRQARTFRDKRLMPAFHLLWQAQREELAHV